MAIGAERNFGSHAIDKRAKIFERQRTDKTSTTVAQIVKNTSVDMFYASFHSLV